MQYRIIVVDDERTFLHDDDDDVKYIRNVGDALTVLVRIWNEFTRYGYGDAINELWLDHDLGDGGDIMIVVGFLSNIADIGYKFPVENIYVHSQNPVGAEYIVRDLDSFYSVRRTPLPILA